MDLLTSRQMLPKPVSEEYSNLPALLAALKACKVSRDLERVRAIHAAAIETGVISNAYLASSLIHAYANCGNMRGARSAFEAIEDRDTVCWNALIFGYVENGESSTALQLFCLLTASSSSSSTAPDSRSFIAALKACIVPEAVADEDEEQMAEALARCRAIHCTAAGAGVASNVFLASTLVDSYARCGCMIGAERIFTAMPFRNLVSWNALMFGYAEQGEGQKVVDLYCRMYLQGCCTPQDRTLLALLRACARLAVDEPGSTQVDGRVVKLTALSSGMAVHALVARSGCERNVYVMGSLVHVYARCGTMVESRRAFDLIPSPDVLCWTGLIFGYADNGEGGMGIQAFALMNFYGYAPNAQAFAAVLRSCCTAASLESGRGVHALACSFNLDTDPMVTNSLLDCYGKCGRMVEAERVFSSLSSRDVVAWNTLIAGYGRQGDTGRVFELFEEMKAKQLGPNRITFLSVLAACSHAGLVAKGREIFESMERKHGVKPQVEHFRCMIDMLGRANEIEEAVEMVRSMPFDPDTVTWKTILSACEKWGNVEVGRLAYNEILALGGNEPAAHILMSNIYRTD